MNKIYKVVWCKATQSLVAVSEFAKSQGKGSASKPRLAKPLLLKSMTIAVLLGISGQLWATCDTTGNKVECGTGSSAHSSQGVAVGSRAKAAGKQSSAFGNDTTAYGVGSLAFGGDDTRAGTSPSVYGVLNGGIGVNNDYRRTLSAGTASTAISMHSQALANGSTAIGAGATAGSASGTINATTGVLTGYSQTSGTDSTAIGALSNAVNDNSSAFGAKAKATADGAVALGAGSVAATAAGATGAYDPQNQTRTGSTWVSTLGAVSVGEDTSTADTTNAFEVTRQIQGVAAGKVDTDAVNVAQLKAAQTHYFSVNSDDSAAPTGTNWNNDGASANNAIAIGKKAEGKQADSLAIGHGASSDVLSGVSLGAVSYTHNGSSVIGNYTGLYTLDENYYATGIPQKGFGATALGAGAQAFGTTDSFKTGGVAIGFVAQANGSSTVGIGTRAEAKGHKAVAIGHFAKTDAISATAIGDKATASKENAIALGSQSVADRVAITATSVTAVTGTADPASNQVYSPIADDTAVKATVKGNLAAVSVGNTNNTRQITHVAAGSQDTDAVNVAQLKAATQASDKQTYFHANDADASNDKNTNTTNYGSVDDTAGAQGINSVAAGVNARAMEEGSVAIGENAWSIAEDGYAMGSGARARGENSIALGTGANAGAATGTATSKEETIAIGNNTQAYASQAITIGSDTKTSGAFGIAIGSNTAARKVNSTGYAGVAIGSGGGNMGAMANGESSVAIGGGNSASSGLDGAVAGGKNAVAIGSGSSAGLKGAVALGSQSVAGRGVSTGSTAATYGGYNPITNTVDGTDATIDGTRSTLAAVSVGDANGTKYRQITNVAAGTENTDVVNVAQLKAASQPWKLRQAGGSNNSINPTDTVEFESGTYTTATVTAENNGVTKVKYDIAADKAKLTFAGDSGTSDVNLGNTYNIKGTTNEIVTTDNGTGTLNIKLADAVKNDIAEGKTIVIGGTNITNVESSGGTGGTPVTYTINADGVTASAGSSAVTVMAGTKDANNVTDYAIDLSQDTKDAIAAGKTIVTAGANTKVTKTAGTGATPDSYVVDAEDTTVTAGSSYVTVSDTLTTGAGVDDYKVDVSQDVKDAAEAVKTGLTFTGDSGTTNNELLGSTIAVNGDSNITTKASGDSITIQLNDDITVTSVTADKVTVGSVTIDNTNGINAGNTQIKGVKAGTAGTDAVNKDQLDAVSQNLANATFGIKAEDSNSVTNTVNNTIDLVGDGKNISTKVEGGKVVVAIKDSPKFGDVTINDGGKITGLTNGNIADGSQEAITGDQLFDTNETVAKGINVGGTTGSNKYTLGDTINVKGDSNVISTTIAGGVQLGLADSVTIGSSKPVTINGNDGTVTGLTNTTWVVGTTTAVSGRAATEDQLQAVSDIAATANKGWKLTTSASAGTVTNPTTEVINSDEIVTIDAGKNVAVTQSGNKITVATKDDVVFSKTTVGNVVTDGTSNKITGLAVGDVTATSSDAVNGSQLFDTNSQVAGNTAALGGGAAYNPTTNVYTAPTYTVTKTDGITVDANDIGTALTNLNNEVVKPIRFAGNTGADIDKQLGDTLAIKGGLADADAASNSNIRVDSEGGELVVKVADNPTFAGTVTAKEVVSTNGTNTIKLDSATGTVTGLTNVDIGSLDDGSSGTSIAATEAQLSKVNATANAGWNLTANGSNTSNVAPNDTVDLANTDGNIELVKSGNDVKFELADDITVNSVTAGDTVINNDGITIANGSAGNPVSLTKDGLDNGGNKVINVADGTISSTSKDAVNGSQLHAVSTANKNIFGGNAAVQADGSVTMSNVGGTGKDNIHDAIASVKTLAGQHSTTTAGKNIEVVETTNANGSTNYAVKTKDAVEFDNVKVGDVVINKDNGINAGDKVISNVASGLNGRTIEAVKSEGSGAAEWNNAATIGDLTTVQNAVSNVYEVIGGQNTSGDAVDGDGNVLTDTDGNPISAKAALQTYDVAGQTATDNNTVISAIKNMNEGGIKYFHTNDASGQTTGGAVANTDDSSASGKFSTAVGYQASATAENALALGNASQATGKNAIAIGTGNKVSGENSGAIGDPNVVSGNASYALGNDNTVTTNKTFVVGNDVSKTLDNSVILGDSSEAIAIHTTATGGNYTYNGANDANVVGVNDVVGVVSVGKDGETRQIQNVAAGVVSATSTDAINGSQLHYTNMAVAGNSANIAINAGNIANNAGRITTNAGNIITNAGNIVTNATHIQANANEIAKGINFAGDEGSLNRQLGDTVTIGGGLAKEAEASSRNIRTVAADDKVTLLVAENPEFKSVTVERGLVINEGATVNMGNNRVQNVAAGVNPTDAVNIRQLAGAYQRINEVNQNANAGIAAALATATISQPIEPGGNTFGLSLGTYEGQQAISVGVSTLSDNGKWTIKGALTQDSQSNTGAAVGVNYNW